MRISKAVLGLMAMLVAGMATVVNAQEIALITSPSDRALVSGSFDVKLQIEGDPLCTWRLLDRTDAAEDPVQLAAGCGDVAPDAPVFSGTLAPGAHTLLLEVSSNSGQTAHFSNVVVTAPTLPGWPYEERLNKQQLSFRLMPEFADGEVVVARNVEAPDRMGLNPGEVTWLDATGIPLPGWPVAFGDLAQAVSPRSQPMVLRRQEELRMQVLSKTHLLEFHRNGQLAAEALLPGRPVGEPVLLPVAGNGVRTLVFVQQLGATKLVEFDENLLCISEIILSGSLAWSRPVLCDMSGDGRLDIVLLVELGQQLQVITVDGATGIHSLLHSLPAMDLNSVLAGDVNADHAPELVLVGRRGPVLALGANAQTWSRDLPNSTLGAAVLLDLEEDGPQELAFLSKSDDGSVHFMLLGAQGQDLAPSGTLLGTSGLAQLAPLMVRTEQGPRFLLTINPDGANQWATQLLSMNHAGQLDPLRWLLPGAPSGSPRLADLDGDKDLELVAGDLFGRWVAWPTTWTDPRPTHPLGDGRHGGVFLQPLSETASPGMLCGAMSLPGGLRLTEDMEVLDLALVSGCLMVDSDFAPRGTLWIGSQAKLTLESGSTWSGHRPDILLEGCLEIKGGLDETADPLRALSSTNQILSGMNLESLCGSRLRLENCLINNLPAPLLVSEGCSLELDRSWLLAGAQGLVVDGGHVNAESSLFQPSGSGLLFNQGSHGSLRGCVVADAEVTALTILGGTVEIHDSQFITCQDAVWAGAGSSTVLDSVHFQGNKRDVVLTAYHGDMLLQHCDFVETYEVGVQNLSTTPVTASFCYWDLGRASVGPVVQAENRTAPVMPLIIPSPVFSVETGPMVDGDEPLEWAPVEFSLGGIPINVEYRIYRSTQPYGLVRPENLIAVTRQSSWRDTENLSCSFYCVTASIGKPVEIR